jgi:guanylate kinase
MIFAKLKGNADRKEMRAGLTASPTRQGLLFLLIGPPGAGKNALMNDALARTENLRQLATATTRAMRPTEAQGREHLFTNTDEFQKMIEDGSLFEWQQVHGNLYGIPRKTVEDAFAAGEDLTADIDVLGATHIRSVYPDNVILIFIAPPTIAELENRMRVRGETEDSIRTRMKRVEMEMTYAQLCDYQIVNDDLQRAANELNEMIRTERQRKNRSQNRRYIHVATAISVYNGEALRSHQAPHFLEGIIPQGELPHQAALHLLEEHLHITALPTHLFKASTHQGSFIPPAAISTIRRDEVCQINFMYLYLMQERIEPPQGWEWVGYQEADLPPSVLEAFEEQMIPR